MTRVQIHLVEAALLALLPERLENSYAKRVDVKTISDKDFGDEGQLILQPPAVRIHFDRARYGTSRDTQRTALNAELDFSFLCFDESLKSRADERTRTLSLVATLQNELAGARLQLEQGVYTEPILLTGVEQTQDRFGPVNECYAVLCMIPGLAQFSGPNANFGLRG